MGTTRHTQHFQCFHVNQNVNVHYEPVTIQHINALPCVFIANTLL
jgi:hypothetical protein